MCIDDAPGEGCARAPVGVPGGVHFAGYEHGHSRPSARAASLTQGYMRAASRAKNSSSRATSPGPVTRVSFANSEQNVREVPQ